MMKFEERLAEIQLRGVALKRKQERRRRGIALGGISLAVCFVLFVSPYLPGKTPSGEAPELGFDMMGSAGGSAGISVRVEDTQTSKSYSVQDDAKSVAALLQQITMVYEMTGAATGKEDPATPTQDVDGAEPSQEKQERDGITIEVTMANGMIRSYLLRDQALQDTVTGKVYPMTDQQAQQLRKLLGIQEAP